MQLQAAKQLNCSDIGYKGKPIDTLTREELLDGFLELAQRVARYDSPVLITGESGVGKELMARYIRLLSSRSKRDFLAVGHRRENVVAAVSP